MHIFKYFTQSHYAESLFALAKFVGKNIVDIVIWLRATYLYWPPKAMRHI